VRRFKSILAILVLSCNHLPNRTADTTIKSSNRPSKKLGFTPSEQTPRYSARDQIWRGINNSKVLIAELTTRNVNVFYELGLAHALQKPVVLVASNEPDVPFDLTSA
jgi:hypothetical protein